MLAIVEGLENVSDDEVHMCNKTEKDESGQHTFQKNTGNKRAINHAYLITNR